MSDLDIINVVLASDDNYAQHVAVVVASVLLHTIDKKRIHFFVLSDDISANNKKKIEITVANLGSTVEFIELSKLSIFNDVYISGHISRATYFRLYLSEILPSSIHKAIYLDVDLLVYDDIVKLWNVDMLDLPLAAVTDLGILSSNRVMQEKINVLNITGEKYFNAGVLILDLDKWRANRYADMIMDLILKNKFIHHDQDGLNMVFNGNWIELPLCWNVIPPVWLLFPKILFNKAIRNKAVEARRNMSICHYAGRCKPWEFKEFSKFNSDYYKYLNFTEFKNVVMPRPGKNMVGKSSIKKYLEVKFADLVSLILR